MNSKSMVTTDRKRRIRASMFEALWDYDEAITGAVPPRSASYLRAMKIVMIMTSTSHQMRLIQGDLSMPTNFIASPT